MSASPTFMDWLDQQVLKIAALEARARELLARDNGGDDGGDAYRAVMRDKATLLANLAQEGEKFLPSLPAHLRQAAGDELRRFSHSAKSSLGLNSVFFMSALLYPEDHKPGQPNDLELFRDELRTEG